MRKRTLGQLEVSALGLGTAKSVTPAQIAFAWCLAQKMIDR